MRKCGGVLVFAVLLLGTFLAVPAAAWSNGGYTGDLQNPGYGTHDWIAQHALDWLPPQEKQLLTDNLASYLYGTELPDNVATPDGIGDVRKHHVYFFANGTLQDDATAVRAQQEYANAQASIVAGNFSAAAEHLGMMTHYIADLAVFGHVMGSATAWGTEVHHSSYESYVLARTSNYSSEFSVFLLFDGALAEVTAYDSAVAVAEDTTFAYGSALTCTWMDQNYNWSNTQFKSRCGDSLNLAVNAVADVLHTFYAETLASTPTLAPVSPSPTLTVAPTLTETATATPQIPEFPREPLWMVLAALATTILIYRNSRHKGNNYNLKKTSQIGKQVA
ncbi:MAG: zinc dependent phospholipase C family protein [Candidatus Bathyarchaeota archaeon]|nr:zinc dependent phospholipase C family protein [Candidatus Bathyarchaeota archaeon]